MSRISHTYTVSHTYIVSHTYTVSHTYIVCVLSLCFHRLCACGGTVLPRRWDIVKILLLSPRLAQTTINATTVMDAGMLVSAWI